MNLPEEAIQVLKDNVSFCFDDKFTVTSQDAKWFRDNLGVNDLQSAFISFYTIVAFPPVGDGPELLPLDTIIKFKEETVAECPIEIGDRFLRLTSEEGGGAIYFDVNTDEVYNIDWGHEEDMTRRKIAANFPSFSSFLEKYYAKT